MAITGHVFIATSLDGFVARPNGDIDWLTRQPTAGEDHGYDAFVADVDGLVMGRGSFEKVLTFSEWPYAIPVVVASRTLQPADAERAHGKVELTDAEPADIMAMLAARGWRRVYVDGGRLVQSFLRANLIADITLTRVPVLIGDGISLFGRLDGDVELEHLGTRAFASGLVTSRYRVIPPKP